MQAPPKFSSFRPEASTSTKPVGGEDKRHSRRRRNRHASHHKPGSPSPLPTVEPEEDNGLFFVDRRGDTGNQTYGTNSKSSIPTYWPTAERKTLGRPFWGVDDVKRRVRPLTSLSREDRATLKHDGIYIGSVLGTPHPVYAETTDGFLPLNPSKKCKRAVLSGDPSASASQGRELIKGSHQPDEEEDVDSTSTSGPGTSDDDTIVSSGLALKQENARLSDLVKSQPQNIEAWQDYIAFQDTWATQDRLDGGEELSSAECRSIAEVKMSMYRKALDTVGLKQPGRQDLLLNMMKEAELVLETVKLASKWREVAESNLRNRRLWLEYLNHGQSSFSTFLFESCRDRFAKYVRLEEAAQEDSTTSSEDSGCSIYAFTRLTRFVSDAGYHELAVALWQAVLEYHVFGPQTIATGRSRETINALLAFEEFWNSELPRIGEEGATGWSDSSANASEPHITADLQHKVIDGSQDRFARWHQHEADDMAHIILPGRTEDEEAADDPYHVVLFSDIEPFLNQNWYSSDQPPTALVNAFLCFEGLPALRTDENQFQTVKLWQDCFLRNDLLAKVDFDASGPTIRPQSSSEKAPDRFSDPFMRNCLTTTEALFGISGTEELIFSSLIGVASCESAFVSNVLGAMVRKYPHWNDIAEYHLAFEMCFVSPSTAKKSAKTLLKSDPSNMRLYNAYALIEARSGKTGSMAAADRVFCTAINMSSAFSLEVRQDLVLLWRTWIWETVRAGDNKSALARLLAIPHGNASMYEGKDNFGDIEVFKTQEYLTAAIHANISHSLHHNTVYHMELLVLLDYLRAENSPSVAAALNSYSINILLLSSVPSTSPALELLHQSRANLLAHHIRSSHPYRPAELRTVLTESIVRFPANTTFLLVYAENESRFRIDDRIRQVTRDVLSTSQSSTTNGAQSLSNRDEIDDWTRTSSATGSVITHSFAISSELRRGIIAGSTQHAVRAAFERAVADRGCRYSASIWSAWVAYECSLLPRSRTIPQREAKKTTDNESKHDNEVEFGLERQRKQIRNVFYRGLRHLPWVKRYAMLAFSLLRPLTVLRDEECEVVYEVMVEKGLRLFHEMNA